MSQDTKTAKRTLIPRRCRYCRASFVPEDHRGEKARFCCENHRKAFWRYGGLPFDKMKQQILKDIKPLIRDEIERCAAMGGYESAATSQDAMAKEARRIIREELSRLLASLGQSTP